LEEGLFGDMMWIGREGGFFLFFDGHGNGIGNAVVIRIDDRPGIFIREMRVGLVD